MIFIDRSIPRPVAQALQRVRDDVRWLEDVFPHDTKDGAWLRDVGARGWIVIARDKKIRSRPGERKAIRDGGVGCFILNLTKDPTRWEYLKLLVATLDTIESTFAAAPRPFIRNIDSQGRISDNVLR